MTAYIEGGSFVVDEYYSQMLGKHNDLREIDTDAPNIYQQYTLIKDLEIKVTDDISNNYNEQEATMQVSGSGVIYAIIPKKADYFVSKSFRGRKTIFMVTSVTRATDIGDTVYEVNYTVIGYADTQSNIYDNLVQRVQRTFVFIKDRMMNGVSPLVRPEARDFIVNIPQDYARLATYYINMFFDRHTSTLILPGQNSKIYDSALVSFVMKTISSRTVDRVNYIRQLPTDSNMFLLQSTVYSAILNKNIADLQLVRTKSMLLPKTSFLNISLGRGAAYTNVDFFVCPKDLDMSIYTPSTLYPAYYFNDSEFITQTKSVNGVLFEDIDNQYVEDSWTIPTIYPILEDEYYIFSSNFYTNTSLKSLLEVMVYNYLNNEPIDIKHMRHILLNFYLWPRLEQFYYGPIILTLLRQMQYQE